MEEEWTQGRPVSNRQLHHCWTGKVYWGCTNTQTIGIVKAYLFVKQVLHYYTHVQENIYIGVLKAYTLVKVSLMSTSVPQYDNDKEKAESKV